MNVVREYVGVLPYLSWFKSLAQSLGVSPLELYEDGVDLLRIVTSVTQTSPGEVVGHLIGGVTLHVRYDPQTLVVHRVEYYYNNALVTSWEGSMSVQQFLADDYPVDVRYGSQYADVLYIDAGTVYAGDGNDVIQLEGGVAYGEGGMDVFEVSNWGHMTIKDYQTGEKILFPDYANLGQLAADFVGVTQAAGGFTLNFSTQGRHWSLTFENTALDTRLLDDFLFGREGTIQVYGPILAQVGLDLSALL